MKATNCRNCGAPPDGSGTCAYCGTRSEIMVMDEALDGADCTRSSYIEITAGCIRIGVLPEMKDLERRRLYERIGT